MRIFWPQTISNKQLSRPTGQDATNNTLVTRRWRRITYVLRKKDDNISKNSTCKTKKTWTVSDQKTKAADKKWRTLVSALCASAHEED